MINQGIFTGKLKIDHETGGVSYFQTNPCHSSPELHPNQMSVCCEIKKEHMAREMHKEHIFSGV